MKKKLRKERDYLSTFNPEKLSVTYTEGITSSSPVIPRRYTLTHSDSTGELFLNVGINYAWGKINALRDEVLGEWKECGNSLCFCIYLYIDQGDFTQAVSAKRYEIFRRELPLALTAIRYGDRILFNTLPYLDQAPIIVNFMSSYPQFARQENWGTFQGFWTENGSI
ncbi:staygreen family protein [Chungangia koreensis]|uniref:Staygreen family protein n=1 Tax=Chungangia koreensis TaxID=752657 RepID=A0ABV8XAP9_9LACT